MLFEKWGQQMKSVMLKCVFDGNIEDEFMSGMKFGWNIRWDELSRGTAKWNQKMKSALQTANEMETEMVTLLCKGGVCEQRI